MRRKKILRINPAKVNNIPEPCIAAGGVVYQNGSGSILLIKRNSVWDLPKGKLENGESIRECAVREVEEETGLSGLRIVSDLCETYHEYRQGGKLIGKTTHWFLMKGENVASQELVPQREEGITELTWNDVVAGRKKLGYENLKDVIDVLTEKLT